MCASENPLRSWSRGRIRWWGRWANPTRTSESDTAGAFDRPGAIAPRPGKPFELPVAVAVVGEPLLGQDVLLGVEDQRGVAALVGARCLMSIPPARLAAANRSLVGVIL